MIMIKITEEWELYTVNFKNCRNNVKMWGDKINWRGILNNYNEIELEQ